MEGGFLDDLVANYSQRLTSDELRDYGYSNYDQFTAKDMINRINKSLIRCKQRNTRRCYRRICTRFIRIQSLFTIEPKGSGIAGEYGNTFAYGNDDVGYQTFINGERIDMADYGYDDVPYSQNEAEIRLQNIMEEREDIDIGMYSGQQQYKRYVDDTLPGGKNYREDVYIYENAPFGDETGGQSHFDDSNQLAHMLGRDRVLEDGTRLSMPMKYNLIIIKKAWSMVIKTPSKMLKA